MTKGTFDAYNWSILENKQKFISQIMRGQIISRSFEDIDATALSFAEVKALASGDPRIMELTELETQVTKLKLLKVNHEKQRYMLEDKLMKFFPQSIQKQNEIIAGLEADIRQVDECEEEFSIVVQGKLFKERKAAGQAILNICNSFSEQVELGKYKGFSLILWANKPMNDLQLTMKGALSYTLDISVDPVGMITKLEHIVKSLPERLSKNRDELELLEKQKAEAQEAVQIPFEKVNELDEKTARLNDLRMELKLDKRGRSASDESIVQMDTQTIDMKVS